MRLTDMNKGDIGTYNDIVIVCVNQGVYCYLQPNSIIRRVCDVDIDIDITVGDNSTLVKALSLVDNKDDYMSVVLFHGLSNNFVNH